MQALPSFVGFRAAGATPRTAPRSAGVQQRQQMVVRASVMAEPATLDVKTLDGSSAGAASLALRVADADTSKGLVHRYLVLVRQNARRVSRIVACGMLATCCLPPLQRLAFFGVGGDFITASFYSLTTSRLTKSLPPSPSGNCLHANPL